jgi:hypothetical protein
VTPAKASVSRMLDFEMPIREQSSRFLRILPEQRQGTLRVKPRRTTTSAVRRLLIELLKNPRTAATAALR